MIADAKLTRLSESAFSIKINIPFINIVLRIQALLLFPENNPVKSDSLKSVRKSVLIYETIIEIQKYEEARDWLESFYQDRKITSFAITYKM